MLILSIDFRNVEYMEYCFAECKNININEKSNLNPRNCINMNYMFYKCDLNFFDGCKNITINEKSILNPKYCINMNYMFYGCDLSNVNFSFLETRNVKNMEYLLDGCINITINNNSILNSINCINMNYMFQDCDLSNINFSF